MGTGLSLRVCYGYLGFIMRSPGTGFVRRPAGTVRNSGETEQDPKLSVGVRDGVMMQLSGGVIALLFPKDSIERDLHNPTHLEIIELYNYSATPMGALGGCPGRSGRAS